MNRPDEDEIAAVDALLAGARERGVDVPDALMARVLADADVFLPTPPVTSPQRAGAWTQLKELCGGWQGLGGLVAATCAGVWIGLSPPETLPDAGAYLLGYETPQFTNTTAELTSFGWDLDEG